MPIDIARNSDLTQHMKDLITSFAVTFSTLGGAGEPRWEREVVEKFRIADAEGNWAAIGNSVRAFEHQVFPYVLQIQSARCLLRCGMRYLVDALANVHQTVFAMQLASALSVDERLRLAATSDNPYVQFGSLYQTLSGRFAAQRLSIEEQQSLTDLLVKVANDGPRWLAWMHVFNGYPVRYPVLQVPLGHALAHVPDAAVNGYVETIVLAAQAPRANAILECLNAFRECAGRERRCLLWRCAHERWLAWNFDKANSDTHLRAITRCELDYAVVGFATECMSDEERTETRNAVAKELDVLEDRWHSSITNIVTAWNRLLSQFQPYAHASYVVASGEHWLTDVKVYFPFDPSTHEYLLMKYRSSA